MKPYEIRITRLSVGRGDEPIFSETVTHIEIENEAAGEFLQITQQSGSLDVKEQQIQITPEEWPKIKEAIETLIPTLRE
jgi:hypothetical protein